MAAFAGNRLGRHRFESGAGSRRLCGADTTRKQGSRSRPGRRMTRHIVVIVSVALAAAILGCQGQPGTTGASRRQRVVSATISDPKTFNPLLIVDSASAAAVGTAFEGLV